MYKVITSTTNDRVKQARQLSLAKVRKQTGLFMIEGEKLFFEALQYGICIKEIFASREFLNAHNEPDCDVFDCTRDVLNAISDVSTPQDIIATAMIPQNMFDVDDFTGMAVALDAVQDPANIGAIIRCADAMGAYAVLLGDGCADAYSPKSIRSAMGSTFHLPVVRTDLENVLSNTAECDIIAGHLDGDNKLPQSLKKRVILVIGNEGNGISAKISELCTTLYRLEMRGKSESLNAAVASGILMYEIMKNIE